MKGIVITTSEHTKDFLVDCLNSIIPPHISAKTNYPILVVHNDSNIVYSKDLETGITHVGNNWNGFELGGILRGKETFSEFVHLMDTTIVKDSSIFDKLFEYKGHVFLTDGGYHYMGKFNSNDLPEIPKINSKPEAIALELHWLRGREAFYFKPDLPVHTNVFEEKHGRKNMVLENDFIIKYKATWSL